VTDDLVPRIEILADMIMQLQLVQLQPSRNRHAQGILLTMREETDISSLMVSAHDVLSEAQSVIAQSETGSDRGSSASTMLHLNNFEGLFRDSLKITQGHQPIEPGGLPFDRHAAVEKWIPAAFPTDETTQSDNSSTNTQTQMTPTQSTFGTSAIGTEYAASATGEDSDEEDELEFDMLKGCLDQGVSFYKQGDWASGEKYFRRALADSKKLSSNKIQQRGIDLKDAQFKTAVCAFQQKRFDEAEAELFHFNSRKSVNTEESNVVLRRVLATYLFAEICFQRNRIDEALKHCRKAHSMNKRLIGNTTDMPEVQANIFNLLMDIALCQWDFVAAEVYEAKELEYRVEPRPKLQMIDLEEILLSRLRRLQNVRELTRLASFSILINTVKSSVANAKCTM
jgi:tetratricopeptide (TPR) repeat protein